MNIDRRAFLKLLGIGTAIVVLGRARGTEAASDDFTFIQLSDTHWGFSDPRINPESGVTLKKAVAAINSMDNQPDFVILTGDITHTTDDPAERRKRLSEARDIISGLKVKNVRVMPGEHDAGLDYAEAYKEYFGPTNYAFKHKGVNFIALDNVSDPTATIGDTQLQWLAAEVQKLDKDSQLVIFTHRPLFDLYPQWDWWTRDGGKAIDILMPYKNVTVLYGHIHQEHHHTTAHIAHHAARGMMYPLPPPGSLPKKIMIPWDAAAPFKGLGYRAIDNMHDMLMLTELPLK